MAKLEISENIGRLTAKPTLELVTSSLQPHKKWQLEGLLLFWGGWPGILSGTDNCAFGVFQIIPNQKRNSRTTKLPHWSSFHSGGVNLSKKCFSRSHSTRACDKGKFVLEASVWHQDLQQKPLNQPLPATRYTSKTWFSDTSEASETSDAWS